MMKHHLFPLLLTLVVSVSATDSVAAKKVWTTGNELLTSPTQISATPAQSPEFGVANLLRPESDGVGTNQYIFHTAWSGPDVIAAGTDPYLQVHFTKAQQHIIFTMTGSNWQSTQDTPTEVDILAANLPNGGWKLIQTLKDMDNDFTTLRPEHYTSPHIDLGAAYTDVKFVVKHTLANRTCDRTDRTGLLLSLGRFQVYEAIETDVEEKDVPIDPKANINLVFIGNSITYGATLDDPTTQAPPILVRQMVNDATGVDTHVFNGGHSGITTFGYLPGRNDFILVTKAANTFLRNNGGLLYFSIMLGTNDSAIIGTEGAPVSTESYRSNMKKIIDELIRRFPTCKIIVNYPLWYSPNTHNGSRYLEEGMTRLRSYYPIIDDLVTEYDQVYAGNRSVWETFENNRSLFTAENGNSGTFYLHPNYTGAVRLAEIWTQSLLELIQADGVKVKTASRPARSRK